MCVCVCVCVCFAVVVCKIAATCFLSVTDILIEKCIKCLK